MFNKAYPNFITITHVHAFMHTRIHEQTKAKPSATMLTWSHVTSGLWSTTQIL